MKKARHKGAQAHARAHSRALKHKYTHGRTTASAQPHAHEQAQPPTRAPRPLARTHNKTASLADERESKRSGAQHPHAFAFHPPLALLGGKTKRGTRDSIGNPNPTFSAVVSNSDYGDGVASPESSRRSRSPPPPPQSRRRKSRSGINQNSCGREGKEKQAAAAAGPSHGQYEAQTAGLDAGL
jgi:hypothetical protein